MARSMRGSSSSTVGGGALQRLALLALHLLAASFFFVFYSFASAAITDATDDYNNGTRAAALAAFTRDADIDATTLPELLARPLSVVHSQLDTQLDLARVHCRELSMYLSVAAAAATRRADSDSSSPENNDLLQPDTAAHERAAAMYCRKARYVRHVREQMRSTLRAELTRAQQEREREELTQQDPANDTTGQNEPQATSLRESPSIETRSISSLDLQAFFETYAETARPVVLTADSKSTSALNKHTSVLGFASDDELAQFRDKCFGTATPSSSSSASSATSAMPLRIHDVACAPLLEHFQVPLFLVHDYLQRTNVSLSETYLPSLVLVDAKRDSSAATTSPSSRKTILSCPHGLHMLAVALPKSTSAPVVRLAAHIFDQRLRPFVQSPASARHEAATSAFEEVTLSAASGDVLDRRGDMFARGVHSNDDALPPITPLYRAPVTLTAGSMLFVPGSQFATLAPDTEARSEQHGALPALLRFCFVDASNFNAVKQEVAVEALMDDEAQTLARALQSHAFDRSMFRRPALKDTLWRNFVAWPKETKLLKKSELLKHADSGGEPLLLSRRERFKQWQDDKRWDRHIESLTLPVSLPPVVVNATRTSVTLRFQDLYEPPKHDITAYGYVVRWRNIDDEGAQIATHESNSNTSGGNAAAEMLHEMNITRSEIERSALPTALFGDDFDGKDIQAVVRGLHAETRYVFSVQIYVSDTSGLESDSSRVVLTNPCSEPSSVRGVPIVSDQSTGAACATLRWLDPADDGGKAISLYLINARIVQGGATEALVGAQDATMTAAHERVFTLNATLAHAAGGSWKSATACPLVPGATYVFRIAAMNAIGAGPWSSASDPAVLSPSHARTRFGETSARRVSLAATVAVPTLKGRGDSDFVPMRAFSVSELAALVSTHGSEVVLATLSESEMLQQQQQQLQRWSSRRAPRVLLSDVREQVIVRGPDAADVVDSLRLAASDSDDDSSERELLFDVWASHFSPRAFHVSSEVVLADPLDASTPLRNAEQVKDRVVIVARGAVPLAFKAYYAQQAGALGVIIADVNNTCRGRFNQRCVPGADRSHGEGFAAQDRHALWEQNRIPCVLALRDASQRLLALAGGV